MPDMPDDAGDAPAAAAEPETGANAEPETGAAAEPKPEPTPAAVLPVSSPNAGPAPPAAPPPPVSSPPDAPLPPTPAPTPGQPPPPPPTTASGIPPASFFFAQASIIASQAGAALKVGVSKAREKTSSGAASASAAIGKAAPGLKKASAQAEVAYADAKLASRVVRVRTGIDTKLARASEPARPLVDSLMRRLGFGSKASKDAAADNSEQEARKEVYPPERDGLRGMLDEFGEGRMHLQRLLKLLETYYSARRALGRASSEISMALAEHGVRRSDACGAAEREVSEVHRKLAASARDVCDGEEARVIESLKTHLTLAEEDAYMSVVEYEGIRNELKLLKESMDNAAASRISAAAFDARPPEANPGTGAAAEDPAQGNDAAKTSVAQAAEETREHLEKQLEKVRCGVERRFAHGTHWDGHYDGRNTDEPERIPPPHALERSPLPEQRTCTEIRACLQQARPPPLKTTCGLRDLPVLPC